MGMHARLTRGYSTSKDISSDWRLAGEPVRGRGRLGVALPSEHCRRHTLSRGGRPPGAAWALDLRKRSQLKGAPCIFVAIEVTSGRCCWWVPRSPSRWLDGCVRAGGRAGRAGGRAGGRHRWGWMRRDLPRHRPRRPRENPLPWRYCPFHRGRPHGPSSPRPEPHVRLTLGRWPSRPELATANHPP